MRLHAHRGDAERTARIAGEERLATLRSCHHARGDGYCEATDFEPLRADRHVVRAAFAQRDRTEMQPCPRLERQAQCRQRPVVVDRERRSVRRRVEHRHQPIGSLDLASAPRAQQLARRAVVRNPMRSIRGVADDLGNAGAVDDIGQQKGAVFIHVAAIRASREAERRRAGNCWRRNRPTRRSRRSRRD